jgi:uncharacterized protein (DUF4415 family)
VTELNIKKLSLSDIKKMRSEGRLYSDPQARTGPELGEKFWSEATLVQPERKISVHLKLDAGVFDFFKQGGRGHLTKMQDVLRTYVEAMKR